MSKIALVTDSTADLPISLAEQNNIHVVPVKTHFGQRVFVGQDLTPEAFYIKLASADMLPFTSPPTAEEFTEVYNKLLQDYEQVVSLHIAAELSETVNSARMASRDYGGRVHVVDSRSVSLKLAIMVLEAARLLAEGREVAEVAREVVVQGSNIEFFFTIETLEYLQRGGRISRVRGMMGSLLNIMPILRLTNDGSFDTVGTVRRREKALEEIATSFERLAAGRTPRLLGIIHGGAREDASKLQQMLEQRLSVKCSLQTTVGPVVGTHTGPGSVGAAVLFQ